MRANKFERRCRVSFGAFVGGEEHTLSPSVLWRMSQALCKAIREVCEMAVEKMNGRAKLIKKDRMVGGQSKTAIPLAPARFSDKRGHTARTANCFAKSHQPDSYPPLLSESMSHSPPLCSIHTRRMRLIHHHALIFPRNMCI